MVSLRDGKCRRVPVVGETFCFVSPTKRSVGFSLTRSRSSMPSSCFTPTGPSLDAPLPSTAGEAGCNPLRGPAGSGSPASTVLSGRYDSPWPIPPRFVVFAWRYHPCTPDSLPSVWHAPSTGRGVSRSAPVAPAALTGGDHGASHVPAEPQLLPCPALRPRRDRGHQADTMPRHHPVTPEHDEVPDDLTPTRKAKPPSVMGTEIGAESATHRQSTPRS